MASQLRLGSAAAGLCMDFLPIDALGAVAALKFVSMDSFFFCLPFFCVYFVVVCSRPVGVTEAQASSGCSAGTQGSELQSACPSALVPAVPCHPSLSLCHSLTVADAPTEGAALHLCWMKLFVWIGVDEAFGINPCQNFLLWKFNLFMT